MILKIENYEGNAIAVVSLSVKDGKIEIDNLLGVDVADIEDFDEYFGTTDMMTRIQLNYEGADLNDRPMCDHYDGSICINIQGINYGHDCDCPDECVFYEY